jgi:hypothetical protein
MIRKRLAILAAFAGLGFIVGCSSSRTGCSTCSCSGGGFMSRLTGRARTVETGPIIEGDSMPTCCGDGPLLMDRGPMMMAPHDGLPSSPCTTPGFMPGSMPSGMPSGVPGSVPFAPPPRLVPEPQAQARPYNP